MKFQVSEGAISAVFPDLKKLHPRFAPFLTQFNRQPPIEMPPKGAGVQSNRS